MDTVAELLLRHSTGDWGDLSANDATFNEQCVERNQQVLSSYPLDVGKIWVITAPDRTYTTLLLPGEY